MKTITISSKYQVVIPKEIRETIGLRVGAKLEIITYGSRIELVPIQPMKKLKGAFKGINTDIQEKKIDYECCRFFMLARILCWDSVGEEVSIIEDTDHLLVPSITIYEVFRNYNKLDEDKAIYIAHMKQGHVINLIQICNLCCVGKEKNSNGRQYHLCNSQKYNAIL